MRWPAIFCLLASSAGFAQTAPPSPQTLRPPQEVAPGSRGADGVRLLLVTGTVAAGIGFAATVIHAGWDIGTTPRDLRARAPSVSPVLVASRGGRVGPGIGWTF